MPDSPNADGFWPCACGNEFPSYVAASACERTCEDEDRAARLAGRYCARRHHAHEHTDDAA